MSLDQYEEFGSQWPGAGRDGWRIGTVTRYTQTQGYPRAPCCVPFVFYFLRVEKSFWLFF